MSAQTSSNQSSDLHGLVPELEEGWNFLSNQRAREIRNALEPDKQVYGDSEDREFEMYDFSWNGHEARLGYSENGSESWIYADR